MLPVGFTTLIEHTIDTCLKAQVNHIVVVVDRFEDQLKYHLRDYVGVEVVKMDKSRGSADSFILGLSSTTSDFVHVLFGDHFIEETDLISFLSHENKECMLVSRLKEDQRNWIACTCESNQFISFGAHHRGDLLNYQMAALSVHKRFNEVAKLNPGRFQNLKVGVGSPLEHFIEESMNEYVKTYPIESIECNEAFFDIDKPWHILELNAYIVKKQTVALTQDELGNHTIIDKSARIDGFVKSGENVIIGKNVWIQGNVILGDNVILEQGSIIEANVMINHDTSIFNHAKIHSYSCIGSRNKCDQGFEFLTGVTMDHVYMVHYGEYYGLIGENSDLGAGTTCGTLRFDDQKTEHVIKDRKETPLYFSNASYLGDYTRTGVGALLMPGVKVGSYSVVGSGVVLNRDVKDHTLIYEEQNLKEIPWGPDKYGF